MKKWIAILSGLLILQLALAVAVNLSGNNYGAFQPQEKLLAFDEKAVDGLRIEDGKDNLVLKKRDGKWVLPESGDFPADQNAAKRLLDRLAGLEKGWPVATTAGAAKRFKLDDQGFERKLTLLAKDQTQAVLYVGTSPGFRKVHVRPQGTEAVYAVAFDTWDANAKTDDWIDKDILKLDPIDVTRVEMPSLVLQRDGEVLRVADLPDGQESNTQEVNSLVGKLAGLRVQSLLGAEVKPEYRQDEPELELKVTRKDGDVLTYRFSKPKDAAYYVLKRSDLDPYFKVAEFAVKPIQDTKREKLAQAVKPKAEATPSEAAGGETQADAKEPGTPAK